MVSLKEAALGYAGKGWPIFPTRSDKTPYTSNGVLDATTSLDQVEEWWSRWPRANPALDVGGAGMMVLDLDPGHSIEELEKNVGPIPETELHSATPRGGKHLFLGLNDGEIIKNSASSLADHVDVRSFHGYVLLPPSRTADGAYVWESDRSPAYRSDEIARAANSAREKHKDRDEWIIAPDLPENVALAIKWLKEDAKIAIEGQGGDGMAYATAAHMKSFGMSEEMAFDLMWEHWNPRCSPPWSPEEVEHLGQKVENGYSYNTSPPGNVTPAYSVARTSTLFKPVVSDLGKGKEWNSGRFRFVDRDGMEEIKAPEWLIEGFIPEQSYCLLFGARGTFKTFVALDIALSIATGFGMGDQASWDVNQSGPVLFAAGEGRASIKKRVSAWEKTHSFGNKATGFTLVDPVPLVTEGLDLFIDGALDASPEGYKLTVIDTVGRAMQGVNENAQEHASSFTQMVQRIQNELGSAVLALHHSGLTDTSRSRGSSVFGADVDTELRLEREGKKYIVGLSMTKQKDGPEWEKKKWIKLNEVHLDPKTASLVAVKADKEEVSRDTESGGDDKAETAIILDVIEEAVLDQLGSNKGRKWSDTALGDAVACYDTIEVKGQWISRKFLRLLREDSSRRVARCYDKDAASDRWRWKD